MPSENDPGRRDFLKLFGAAGVASVVRAENAADSSPIPQPGGAGHSQGRPDIHYPRTFTGAALKMISFPLGGIGAGSIGLGGRGQLRDWEIFNRPDKGNSLPYAFPSIWVQAEGSNPTAHVLEARIEPPYQGQDGLGSHNAPGLSRLGGATFTGEFPLAHIEFHDNRLPVAVKLEAG